MIQINVRGTVYIHLKGVGNSSEITSKMSFLRYSTGESVMIVESFWHRPRPCTSVSKFYFTVTQCHVKVSGNPPTILGNFQESSGKFPGTFPTTPLPIPTHSTPLPPDPPTYPPILFPTPKHFKLIFLKLLFRYHFGRISHFPTPFISLLQKPRSLNL